MSCVLVAANPAYKANWTWANDRGHPLSDCQTDAHASTAGRAVGPAGAGDQHRAGMFVMDDVHFLAVKPLSVKTTRASCADAVILNVMRHNARELQAEIGVGADSGIDPSRVHLNVILHGPATADGVASAARDAMREHGIAAPRKNATLGIEVVVSLPAGLGIDHMAYFRDAVAWAQRHYRVPMLSAIVHNDESSPHLHVVLLPVRDGKLVGSQLLGNRATMKAMQKDFHEQVAKQYGLRMPTPKKGHGATERAAGIALLRSTLQTNSGLTDRAIDALLVPHAKNPEPLLLALGLTMPASPVKGSFIATMTRKVRPENPNRGFMKSPIGDFGTETAAGLKAENEMSYALLGHRISLPDIPSQPASLPATEHAADWPEPLNFTMPGAVQRLDALATEDALKSERIFPVDMAASAGEVQDRHPIDQRQQAASVQSSLHTLAPAIDVLPGVDDVHALHASLASSTAAPAESKTGKRGNAAAPGGRAAMVEVRKSDIAAGAGQSSNLSIASTHQVGQTDAPHSASPGTAAANNRKWVANAQKLPLKGDLGDFQRLRDADYLATCWDSERGEFAPATGPPGAMHHHE